MITASTFLLAAALMQPADPAAQVGAVVPVRELVIGSIDDPTTALSFIAYGAALSDSTFVITQPLERQLKVLDSRGRVSHIIGREGGGPGEFSALSRVGRLTTSGQVWAQDVDHPRISVFDDAGRHVREIPLSEYGFLSVIAVSSGDTLIAYRSMGRNRVELVAIDARAPRSATSLVRWQESSPGVGFSFPGGRATVLNPIRDGPIAAASSDGSHILFVERPAPSSARLDSFTVTVFRRDLSRITARFPYRPVRTDRAIVESIVEWMSDLLLSTNLEGHPVRTVPRAVLHNAIRDSLEVPRHLPPISAALVGSNGLVWLAREFGGSRTRWEVLSPALGRQEATFELPGAARPLAAEGGRLWVVETDEFDVPYVVRYRVPGLDRPPP